MNYGEYKNGIFKMWEIIKQDDFIVENDEIGGEEFAVCGLCNPSFGVACGRTASQPCPFDTRSEKDIDDKPCMDYCHIFVKGTAPHKLRIIMSKFMSKFVTAEGQASLKSLAKACRGQKGVSKEAANDFVTITEKVIKSTELFGGFEFNIVNGKLGAKRRND